MDRNLRDKIKNISNAEFNKAFEKVYVSERKGYNLKTLKEIPRAHLDRNLNIVTLATQDLNGSLYEYGKKITNYSSPMISNLTYTDIRLAFATPYTEEEILNLKGKERVNQKIGNITYDSVKNVKRTFNKEDKLLMKTYAEQKIINENKIKKNINKSITKQEERDNIMRKLFNL